MRFGLGFDIHRLVPGRPFVLGGLTLACPRGPVGHSDGDVLLHALVDALYGAAGLGDIGDRFPDTDPRWKGVAGKVFVAQAVKDLAARGLKPAQVDATVFLEAPKLGVRKPELAAAVAKLLDLPEDRVCVKAKTMEGLGALGAGTAVAAQVLAVLGRGRAARKASKAPRKR
ncbi:MAG: 2-C-methyl-D-erythritol 2,4-cyclodiphosphate synthase [Candidatus Brocadiae bacterium]|nr:2-C-methyl-D-erythritol 2,4-cyclodiphosphate synthase [Candidatus Brocadiia bacterium]